MAFDYDLFVIGGGSGGVRAARTAAYDDVREILDADQVERVPRRRVVDDHVAPVAGAVPRGSPCLAGECSA